MIVGIGVFRRPGACFVNDDGDPLCQQCWHVLTLDEAEAGDYCEHCSECPGCYFCDLG